MTAALVTLDALRRYAVARSLFAPRPLIDAVKKLGYLQADPIRAPARAQDLILRHRFVPIVAGSCSDRMSINPTMSSGFAIPGCPKLTNTLGSLICHNVTAASCIALLNAGAAVETGIKQPQNAYTGGRGQ